MNGRPVQVNWSSSRGLSNRWRGLSILGMMFLLAVLSVQWVQPVQAGTLKAGAAKVDITNLDAGPVNDRSYARALVLSDDQTTVVIVGVDAVAIGQIGYIGNEYLGKVRDQLQKDLGIEPSHVAINASHCHSIVCKDVAERTVEAVKQAGSRMVPVKVGAGVGHEDRVSENRRFKLKSGREVDSRHAYSIPPDEEVVEVGPIDPEIGLLRLDSEQGETIAVLYNFACHPIQGAASGGNTADMTGFSSKVIEENLAEGAIAVFIQGCGGDINPIRYKEVANPRDGEIQGSLLGLSALRGIRKTKIQDSSELKVINETLELPRADLEDRIVKLEQERQELLETMSGTSLNFKSFMELFDKYNRFEEYPSYYSHLYLTEKMLGRNHLRKMDEINRSNMEAYRRNINAMEELTRMKENLRLLRMHQAQNVAAGKRTVDVELVGIRVGNFKLITFPGELTVRIGLNIKQQTSHDLTFVAGYTNGYIYYAPTTEQLLNVGGAQEDSDCILAPEWQPIFEKKALDILERL